MSSTKQHGATNFGKAIEGLPNLGKITTLELEDFVACCERERGIQETILQGATEGEDVADVLARVRELGRWIEEAKKEQGKRPVERQPRRLLTLEELEAEAGKEVEWLIKGLRLPIQGSCLIAGPPGIGKSFLALHSAICVAAGDDFLKHYPTRKGYVVYVDEESSKDALNMRQLMLRNGNGLHLESLPLSVSVKQGFLLDHKGALNELIALLKPLTPALLILDALIRLHTGEENSAKDMGKVTKSLARIQREVGCAIILIQHQRKQGLFNSRRDVVRGSSEITAWPDSVITLERNGDHHEAYVLKSRFSEDGQVIIYTQFIDSDSDMAVLEFIREEEADTPKAEKAKRAITGFFKDDKIWTRQELLVIAKPMGFGRNVTIEALASLENEGVIASWRGGIGGAYRYQGAEFVSEQRELVPVGA